MTMIPKRIQPNKDNDLKYRSQDIDNNENEEYDEEEINESKDANESGVLEYFTE